MSVEQVAAIVIGRNEGARLERCLRSLRDRVSLLIYVDSQSTDQSVELARTLGVEVVELDLSVPFTAARARNAGFERLLELASEQVEFVQFVDGDCEVVPDWVEFAVQTLADNAHLVAVTGVRCERYPERSIYNQLCDIEWRQGPFGETNRFGGDVMARVAAVKRAGGYNPRVIAAEDDEFALRLCAGGRRVLRSDRPMTLHDADMRRLSQWWRRAKRCGYGYAQVGQLHGAAPVHKFRTERRRVITWGMVVPAAVVALAPMTFGTSLLLSSVYPFRAARIAQRSLKSGLPARASVAWGLSCAFASFPEALGLTKYHIDRMFKRAPTIIEYKGAEPKGASEDAQQE